MMKSLWNEQITELLCQVGLKPIVPTGLLHPRIYRQLQRAFGSKERRMMTVIDKHGFVDTEYLCGCAHFGKLLSNGGWWGRKRAWCHTNHCDDV
jgi:hypothetical protein